MSAGIFCAAVGVAAAGTLIRPTSTVRALLLLSPTTPKVIFNTADNIGENAGDFVFFQKTQAELITTRPVLMGALQQSGVADLPIVRRQADPFTWLEKEVKVENKMGSLLLNVGMKGDQPEQLVVVVHAVVKAYLEEVVEKDRNKRTTRLNQLKGIYDQYEKTLQKKRAALQEVAAKAGSGDSQVLTAAHQAAIDQLSMAKKELMQCRSELRKLQVEVEVGLPDETPRPPDAVPDAAVDIYLRQDPVSAKLLQRLSQLEEDIEQIKGVSVRGDEDPSLEKYRNELAAVKKPLASRRNEFVALLAEQAANKSRLERQANLAQKSGRITVLKELDKMLAHDAERLTQETRLFNTSAMDVMALRQEMSQSEQMASRVSAEAESLRVEIQAPPRITLWEDATVTPPDAKLRLLGMGGAGVCGLLFGLVGVTWLEVRSRRITDTEAVLQGLGVAVLGSIPRFARGKASQTWLAETPGGRSVATGMLIESVDTTRALLLHAAELDGLRVIMVTSALGGEGKTSLSANLAVSLARSGRRTVLVDCDLRRPALQRVFTTGDGPGLSDLLRGESSVAEAVQGPVAEGLWVLPAGEADYRSFHALARNAIRPVLEELKAQFDMVLIDSCPVLPVSDTLLIAPHVDGVIFSVLQGVSRMPAVQDGWNRLEWLGTRMLGIVVNGVKDPFGYGYGRN